MPIKYPQDADPHSEKAAFVSDRLIQGIIDGVTSESAETYGIGEIRELLAHCQCKVMQSWDYFLNDIDRKEGEIVFEDDSYIVLDLGTRTRPSDYLDTYNGSIPIGESAEDIVAAIHRSLARELTSKMWADTHPFVIRKPPLWEIVEEHVVRRIGHLARERGSVGRGGDAFAVEIQGQNQKFWANRTNRTRQAVNNSLSRGKRESSSKK